MAAKGKVVTVPKVDRGELGRRVRSQTIPAREARGARIVLLSAQDTPAAAITEWWALAAHGDAPRVCWRPRWGC